MGKADHLSTYLTKTARIPEIIDIASKLPDGCRFRPVDWHMDRAERARLHRMAKSKALKAAHMADVEPPLPPPEIFDFEHLLVEGISSSADS